MVCPIIQSDTDKQVPQCVLGLQHFDDGGNSVFRAVEDARVALVVWITYDGF